MTHKTISVTMANDDAFALFEIGAAFQRIAQRHGLEVVERPPQDLTHAPKNVGNPRNEVLDAQMAELAVVAKTLTVDTDKAQLAALGEELEYATEQVDLNLNHVAIEADGTLTVVAPSITTDSPQLDADGLPWDARIHSDSRARNADDTWRARRKPKDMDETEWAAYVSDIRAELKRVMELPVEQGFTDHMLNLLPDPQDRKTALEHIAEVVVEPVEPEPVIVVPPPPAPVETVAPPAPVGELPTDFIKTLHWITGNGWTSVEVDPALERIGLKRLEDLKNRPDMIPVFCDEVLKGV